MIYSYYYNKKGGDMNLYAIEDQVEVFSNEIAGEADFNQISKIININKHYKPCRDFIIKNENYSTEQKIRFFEMLDVIYRKKNTEIKTSNYDNKPYTMTFFSDFLNFLANNNLSQNEIKLCMAIYAILEETNTFGNVLLSVSNSMLAEKTGIDTTNISKSIKSLSQKGLIKKQEGALYLNYQYFYRGSKVDYDRFKKKFDEITD
jgi:predicted transcriptional regulator